MRQIRDKHLRTACAKGLDEGYVRGCDQRRVQYQGWEAQQRMAGSRICRRSRRKSEDAGPVGEPILHKLPFVRLKQRAEIGCHMRKRIRLYLLKPQFRDDICYRTGEPGTARKFCITAKRTALGQFVDCTVRDRSNTERSKWDDPLRGQRWSCER